VSENFGISLFDLEEALEIYWRDVANNFPNVDAMDVIVMDLTGRETTPVV